MPARTRDEFEAWYAASGGDPWDYQSRSVIARLRRSIDFVRCFVPRDYTGVMWEVGCFQGQFTRLLRESFPQAHIVADDISDAALAIARRNVPNVEFRQGDLLTIQPLKGDLVFALECIYYLRPEERVAGLENLTRLYPRHLVISANITGGQYVTDTWLKDEMGKLGYVLQDRRTLNFRFRLLNLLSYFFPMVLTSSVVFANQAIYFFTQKST